MAISQGNVSTGPQGLTLKAWGLGTGGGTLVSSSGISAFSKSAQGVLNVTLTTALANTNYTVVVRPEYTQNTGSLTVNTKATNSFQIGCFANGALNDLGMVHFEVYA